MSNNDIGDWQTTVAEAVLGSKSTNSRQITAPVASNADKKKLGVMVKQLTGQRALAGMAGTSAADEIGKSEFNL